MFSIDDKLFFGFLTLSWVSSLNFILDSSLYNIRETVDDAKYMKRIRYIVITAVMKYAWAVRLMVIESGIVTGVVKMCTATKYPKIKGSSNKNNAYTMNTLLVSPLIVISLEKEIKISINSQGMIKTTKK